MPNLTPIALTEEEHEKLTSLKHKLEANSWREMLMKLCDIYDGYSQTETNTQPEPEETITENPEPESNESIDQGSKEETKPQKEGGLSKLFKGLGTERKKEMNEEDLRRVLREELGNWRIELPEHSHEPKEQPIKDKCEGCGTEFTYAKNKRPKYCPECEGEFDWEE